MMTAGVVAKPTTDEGKHKKIPRAEMFVLVDLLHVCLIDWWMPPVEADLGTPLLDEIRNKNGKSKRRGKSQKRGDRSMKGQSQRGVSQH